MAISEIPVINETVQTFDIPIDGEIITLRLTFNPLDNLWRMSATDAEDNKIFSGRPLVTGQILNTGTSIDGFMFLDDSENTGASPDFEQLVGGQVTIIYVDPI